MPARRSIMSINSLKLLYKHEDYHFRSLQQAAIGISFNFWPTPGLEGGGGLDNEQV